MFTLVAYTNAPEQTQPDILQLCGQYINPLNEYREVTMRCLCVAVGMSLDLHGNFTSSKVETYDGTYLYTAWNN